MPIALTVRDETTMGQTTNEFVVEFLTEELTVRELIRSRIYQEVQDYNRTHTAEYRGLVQPTDAERTLNGSRPKTDRQIDWKQQFDSACEAFDRAQVLVLVDDQQVESLDQTVTLRPKSAEWEATSVTFLKLTPLVGG
jgi:hypothetical protein